MLFVISFLSFRPTGGISFFDHIQLVVQKTPRRIMFGYQFVFLFPSPVFQFPFSIDRVMNPLIAFKVNQVNAVLFSGKRILLRSRVVQMLVNSFRQIVRNTDVQNPFAFVGRNVNVVVVRRGCSDHTCLLVLSFKSLSFRAQRGISAWLTHLRFLPSVGMTIGCGRTTGCGMTIAANDSEGRKSSCPNQPVTMSIWHPLVGCIRL